MYSNNAANNFPLQGYKFTSFEGGIRVIGAIGGGFIDTGNKGGCIGCQRPLGSRLDGIVHGTDWYATFAGTYMYLRSLNFSPLLALSLCFSIYLRRNHTHTHIFEYTAYALVVGSKLDSVPWACSTWWGLIC